MAGGQSREELMIDDVRVPANERLSHVHQGERQSGRESLLYSYRANPLLIDCCQLSPPLNSSVNPRPFSLGDWDDAIDATNAINGI